MLLGKKPIYFLQSKDHNKEMIPITIDKDNDYIRLLFTPEELIEIANEMDVKDFYELFLS